MYGSLTTTPQNVLVLRGQDAILNCSSNITTPAGLNPIYWQHDLDLISSVPCTAHSTSWYVTSPPNSTTDCNLRVLASSELISGSFRCQEQGSEFSQKIRAVATVVVLGKLRQSLTHFQRDRRSRPSRALGPAAD